MGAGTPADAMPRFPSPLIKPDVPISGIRLSEWLHRRLTYARLSKLEPSSFFAFRYSLFERSRSVSVFPRLIANHHSFPPSQAHHKRGPFPPPALPGFHRYLWPSPTP